MESTMKFIKDPENLVVLIVTILVTCIVGAYLIAFSVFNWEVSNNPSNWGPLGDYFGGLLNPIIALAALIALIRASKFQKSEFVATRKHLEKEASKNEIFRLISNLVDKIDNDLNVEVKNDSSKETIVFGPLRQYLLPNWNVPPRTYISLGNSNLCTPIKEYCDRLSFLFINLDNLLEEYNAIDNQVSLVSKHYSDLYNHHKTAANEQKSGNNTYGQK
jgi:uncharacterized membrane protein